MNDRRIRIDRAGRASALGALLFGATTAFGQGPDVIVNQDPVGLCTNETSLIQDLTNPNNLVMAFNDDPYPGTIGLGVGTSNNGGLTWTHVRLPTFTPPMVDCFDPVTAADMQGNMFVGHISTDGFSPGQSGLACWVRPAGMGMWMFRQWIDLDPTNLVDKPHLCADVDPASPNLDFMYAAWIRDWSVPPFSDIYFSHAPPYPAPFVPRQLISDAAPGTGMGNGPNVAVAIDGTVFVAWTDCDVTQNGNLPGTIFLDRSFDNGVNWGTDIVVQNILTVPDRLSDFQAPLTDAIARSYVCLETSPFNANVLYMTYAADPDGTGFPTDEADVFFTFSMNRGVSWSIPLDISATYLPFTMGHEFEPWIDVKRDGTIDLAFYVAPPNDTGTVFWDVVLMRSVDGGISWTQPLVVTDTPFATPTNPFGTPWMGEYLGLVVDNNYAYLGFTTSYREPIGDVYFDRVENTNLVPLPCIADFDGNNSVGFFDLNQVLSTWGPCPQPCPTDFNRDGNVGFFDLNYVLNAWGPCP